MSNARNIDLFGSDMSIFEHSTANEKWNEIDESTSTSKMIHSRSMMSLSKIPDSLHGGTLQNRNKSNRYSELIGSKSSSDENKYDTINSKKFPSKMRSSATTGNIRQLANQQQSMTKQLIIQQTTITKNCISNPCAFMHINSLKDGDQRIKLIVENCDNTDKKFQ